MKRSGRDQDSNRIFSTVEQVKLRILIKKKVKYEWKKHVNMSETEFDFSK